MITQIYIPDKLKENYAGIDQSDLLKGFGRVNIFVGPNNSGKIRFMRGLFINDFKYQFSEADFDRLSVLMDLMLKETNDCLDKAQVADISGSSIEGVRRTGNDLTKRLSSAKIPEEWKFFQEIKNFKDRLMIFEFGGATHFSGVTKTGQNWQKTVGELHEIGKKHSVEIDRLIPATGLPKFKKIYIPMLRGLRPIQVAPNSSGFDNERDSYRARTVKDYFYESIGSLEEDRNLDQHTRIFTGLSLYNEVKRQLLGKLPEREKIRKFEEFLSNTFFESKAVSLVPNIDEDCLNITIGAEDRSIYDLGDGIQNIVILLYQAFVHVDKQALIFIEEPETSLHPGMQRLFIDTIMDSKFKQLQFFITTHSNHFLDMTLDHDQISIYNFTKASTADRAKHTIENSQNNDIRLLEALGVRNSSVFMSNCTVWVEGITDRFYLNKYMQVYQEDLLGDQFEIKRLKEDSSFSYIEYGGANLAHFSFDDEDRWEQIKASRISNRILLIADKDSTDAKPESKKAARLVQLRKHLGDHLIVLECREIENSLSPGVIEATVREIENKKIDLGDFTEGDYKDEYLGAFIDKRLAASSYAGSGSGTIQQKVAFCKKAIGHIHSASDLSDYGRKLARQVYDFVSRHNR